MTHELRQIRERVREDRIDSALASLIARTIEAGVSRETVREALDAGHRDAGRV